jgi:hypothetical protein
MLLCLAFLPIRIPPALRSKYDFLLSVRLQDDLFSSHLTNLLPGARILGTSCSSEQATKIFNFIAATIVPVGGDVWITTGCSFFRGRRPIRFSSFGVALLNTEHGRLLSAFAAKLGDPCACLRDLRYGRGAQVAVGRHPTPGLQVARERPAQLADAGRRRQRQYGRGHRRGPAPRPRT